VILLAWPVDARPPRRDRRPLLTFKSIRHQLMTDSEISPDKPNRRIEHPSSANSPTTSAARARPQQLNARIGVSDRRA
jgi:hypothetical protein